MAADAFQRAGLTASVVSLSILRATAYAPNKKANPSRGKMALRYLVQVDLAGNKSFQDEVDWRAAGAGRNCYFFRSYHLALKMFVDDEKRWSVHQTEHEGLSHWAPLLPRHLPGYFGRFILEGVCQDGHPHRIDSLLVGKAGPTLGTVLTEISKANATDWQQQVRQHFYKVVCACENAHKAGLIFQNDLHMENICLDELSGEYIFVDVENFQSAPDSAVFVQGMKTALKHLTGNQTPAGQAPKFFKDLGMEHIKDGWQDISARVLHGRLFTAGHPVVGGLDATSASSAARQSSSVSSAVAPAARGVHPGGNRHYGPPPWEEGEPSGPTKAASVDPEVHPGDDKDYGPPPWEDGEPSGPTKAGSADPEWEAVPPCDPVPQQDSDATFRLCLNQ